MAKMCPFNFRRELFQFTIVFAKFATPEEFCESPVYLHAYSAGFGFGLQTLSFYSAGQGLRLAVNIPFHHSC